MAEKKPITVYHAGRHETEDPAELWGAGHWGPGVYCGLSKNAISSYSSRPFLYTMTLHPDAVVINPADENRSRMLRGACQLNRLTGPWNFPLGLTISHLASEGKGYDAMMTPVSLGTAAMNWRNLQQENLSWILVNEPTLLTITDVQKNRR